MAADDPQRMTQTASQEALEKQVAQLRREITSMKRTLAARLKKRPSNRGAGSKTLQIGPVVPPQRSSRAPKRFQGQFRRIPSPSLQPRFSLLPWVL
ncbi:hypothetical protein [Kumtagia ephedrae]|uniref:hypothetical protein n=1 Tax=Kumtagia ephedrae TaxID=2116701 RepID=UPI0010570ACE|nr:hypothetical protein [Mesorhizobium ephedrae]